MDVGKMLSFHDEPDSLYGIKVGLTYPPYPPRNQYTPRIDLRINCGGPQFCTANTFSFRLSFKPPSVVDLGKSTRRHILLKNCAVGGKNLLFIRIRVYKTPTSSTSSLLRDTEGAFPFTYVP
jgi:hypothetical protein